MVEAHDVVDFHGAADALDPPLETALGEHIPAIERIAPALAGRGKVVGWHAGYADRFQFLVELEEFRMNPDVGRIHVDEDGHVAKDAYRTACSSLLEKVPLLRKSKLQHLLDHALARVLGGSLGEGMRIAAAQRLRPFGPRARIKRAAQHGVERVIVEPRGLLAAEGFEIRPLIFHILPGECRLVQRAIQKVAGGLAKQRKFLLLYAIKIDGTGARGQTGNAIGGDPTPVAKHLQADERGIAGKGRGRGVGRIAESRGTERQNLPDVLPGALEKADKLVRCRPQIANAAGRWQRGDMQQDS